MNSPIYFHRYTLRSRKPLNATTNRTDYHGALIRVGDGFGCIHPWPERGDAPLDEQLARLAQGSLTPLSSRAMHSTRWDAKARELGENLFENLQIPPSHYTVPQGEAGVPKDFHCAKLKGSADLVESIDSVRRLPPNLRFRIDFNETLNLAQLIEFWEELGSDRRRVDFIEDPVKFDRDIWDQLNESLRCRLAVDLEVEAVGTGPEYRIVKPAIDDPAKQMSLAELFNQKLVFTSYMDHPVGQLFAAFEAGRARRQCGDRVTECGLVTHHLFDADDPFIDALGPPTPVLTPPPGTGLGFDDLLDQLPWKLLTSNS